MMSATFPYEKKHREVLGQSMAYVDEGQGDPIVFLHGNPPSSSLWRNVLPHADNVGRDAAPDIIGMGDSEKLPDSGPDSYTFAQHRRYLDALLDRLGVRERVTLVVHDWGSALGFDWAYRHQDAVRGIAYLEAIVMPRKFSEMPEPLRQTFQALLSSAGEQMVLEQNIFIEVLLQSGMLRQLTQEELQEYHRPWADPGEGRRPMLSWPRQAPYDGEPADVTEIATTYGAWLSRSLIPKLFMEARARRDGAERTGVLPKLSRSARGHGTRNPRSPGGRAF